MRNKCFFIRKSEWGEVFAEILFMVLFVYFSPQTSDSLIRTSYYLSMIFLCVYLWSKYSLLKSMDNIPRLVFEKGAMNTFDAYVMKRLRGLEVIYLFYLVLIYVVEMRTIDIWFLSDEQRQGLLFVLICICMLRAVIIIFKQSLFKTAYKKL